MTLYNKLKGTYKKKLQAIRHTYPMTYGSIMQDLEEIESVDQMKISTANDLYVHCDLVNSINGIDQIFND